MMYSSAGLGGGYRTRTFDPEMFSRLTDATAWLIYSYLKAVLVKLASYKRFKSKAWMILQFWPCRCAARFIFS